VKLNIKTKIREYKKDLIEKFEKNLKKQLRKEKKKLINLLIL